MPTTALRAEGPSRPTPSSTGAITGHEAKLWKMADALRGSMDAAEYKNIVLGLIFLKYISDAFEEVHARLELERDDGADPDDPDEYRAENIFWVPPAARWSHLRSQAKQPGIGRLVDDAMAAIERDNGALRDVLPKDYARQSLDQMRLGQIIDLVSNIRVGDEASRAKDVLGRVYEYFLSMFANAEGKRGGEFYTPRCVVKLLVEMIEPFEGTGLRPLLRLVGHVRAVDRVHSGPSGHGGARQVGADEADARRRGPHLNLRPGIEPHDLAAGPDEPRDSRGSRARSPTATPSTTTNTPTSRPTSSSPTRPST